MSTSYILYLYEMDLTLLDFDMQMLHPNFNIFGI